MDSSSRYVSSHTVDFDNENEHNEGNEMPPPSDITPCSSTDLTTQTKLSGSASASENLIAPFNYDSELIRGEIVRCFDIDVITRWNSTLDILQTCFPYKQQLIDFTLANHRPTIEECNFCTSDWTLFGQCNPTMLPTMIKVASVFREFRPHAINANIIKEKTSQTLKNLYDPYSRESETRSRVKDHHNRERCHLLHLQVKEDLDKEDLDKR
ncbi:hypothetical protein M9H77_30172 [Catharanthus roseus]|uniref:Uncharacterized protein n=1 Tax=Catharanthus roseus TaxID=4058 RepID=A0ACB9ZYC9_CATRO|nr:hypothetical protein M9H77_30172 [Catharanthus roseus]